MYQSRCFINYIYLLVQTLCLLPSNTSVTKVMDTYIQAYWVVVHMWCRTTPDTNKYVK